MIFENNRNRIRCVKPKLKYVDGEYVCWIEEAQVWLNFSNLKQACQFIRDRLDIK